MKQTKNRGVFLLTVLAAAAVGLMAGCEPEKTPESTQTSATNSQYQVDTLFTDADGFTMKRVFDVRSGGSGEYIYYVTGPGAARVEYEVPHGKSRRKEIVNTTPAN